MSARTIASRTFSMVDQSAFGALSGDWNPVHTDREYARRTMFGDVVVHGVHAVLWALDSYVAGGGEAPSTLRAQFAKPIFPGDPLTLKALDDGGVSMLVVDSGGVTLATVTLNPSVRASAVAPAASSAWSAEPRVLSRESLARLEFDLPSAVDPTAVADMFPSLAAAIGARASGALALLSRLVGMECPGKQSLFAGFAVSIERGNGRVGMTYRVRRWEPAFAPIEIEVAGPDLSGTITAFYRPPEVAQPSFAELRARVDPSEFACRRPLVVGGSRGLGELTAKLLAAGGAQVAITYAVGADDAERVRGEIADGGGRCQAHQLDALDPGRSLAGIWERFAFDSVYYFATPRISGRRKVTFEPERLRAFERYYVDAFADICLRAADLAGRGRLALFFPSTVFIDEHSRDNIEYAAAKSAGETVAAYLTSSGVARVVSRRLPRMATDQTAGIVHVSVADSVTTLLEAVREMDAVARALPGR